MPYTIKVEQRHIDHGKRDHCQQCPIALSAMECLPIGPGQAVSVTSTSLRIFKRDESSAYTTETIARWPLPWEARQFIAGFDALHRVYARPFAFQIG